ncbi:hypothetical protein BO70DRAFT_169020 [Aspergillus heteromorphus CBS 117.55]|uniref:Uncharacterized protein n=1 Tax=Aspergillus heteromorphus CBS 117.55 TaxID=1448321 RepID=A0A317V435_9EURO|nr:uncharacterized protein BO70DRAFT_169020 [Aspergillus heteromorphus CBS 117.55]PWY67562.1 hypothetical protein BO70DRAFT_169020 [Aspergillus heteromorphus CBS 117.55]
MLISIEGEYYLCAQMLCCVIGKGRCIDTRHISKVRRSDSRAKLGMAIDTLQSAWAWPGRGFYVDNFIPDHCIIDTTVRGGGVSCIVLWLYPLDTSLQSKGITACIHRTGGCLEPTLLTILYTHPQTLSPSILCLVEVYHPIRVEDTADKDIKHSLPGTRCMHHTSRCSP